MQANLRRPEQDQKAKKRPKKAFGLKSIFVALAIFFNFGLTQAAPAKTLAAELEYLEVYKPDFLDKLKQVYEMVS